MMNCSECGSENTYLVETDASLGESVYKCRDCGRRWIE